MSDVIPSVCFSMAYSNPLIIEVAIVIVATPTLIEKAATKAAKFRDLFFHPKKNLKPTKYFNRTHSEFLFSSLTVFKTSVFFIKIRVNLRNLGMR